MEDTVDGDLLEDVEALNYDDLYNVSKLQKTQRHTDVMQKVEHALEDHGVILEDDPEYLLIVDRNMHYQWILRMKLLSFVTIIGAFPLSFYYGGFSYSFNHNSISGKPLPEKVLQMTIESSKLMGTAGGLSELAKIPAWCQEKESCRIFYCNIAFPGIGTNNFSGTVPSKLGKLSKLEHGNKQFLWSSVIRAC
ncbi:hypothetical protein Patl1_06823 [Pistacia atlantica]|uniref:Uncharacterized protein n=1 Tax=Pistacia atlantica TaxID=434234 RepID=A0ACC1AFT5_9ROSI|nr:hypothetical protein Patl1_06823 [Pistacia atlantica]